MPTLDVLPDHSRVWVFTTAEPLSAQAAAVVEASLAAFVADWMSHGARVRGGFAVLDRRFIVVAADEAHNDVSGCSIDGMFRAVHAAVQSAGVALADTADIAYRTGTGVELVDRPTFRRLVREGVIRADTPVFDGAVRTLGEMRDGKWERPFAASWHAEHFAPTT
ncbi:MAG: hypothetical protein NZ585_12895 [Chloracidobacterium sp.]|nr:hypothetical protein [Chloracidobacterium sp.]MDW8217815.1 hypothetical protein [Acidobacteriota bacterium]